MSCNDITYKNMAHVHKDRVFLMRISSINKFVFNEMDQIDSLHGKTRKV